MPSKNPTGDLLSNLNTLKETLVSIDSGLKGLQSLSGLKSPYDLKSALAEVAAIGEKLRDPHFTVGIIGEFSSGKSTFLNAFLERRCLTEAITAGTTCANTEIRYAPAENVIVEYNDGRTQKMHETGLKKAARSGRKFLKSLFGGKAEENAEENDVPAFLRQVTAVEEEARNISRVYWEVPVPVLKGGFVLVDTPGIGTVNPRHTEVARQAAAQCDALLVLTLLAGAGTLSASLIAAVQQIAGKNAPNCIFIGTRLDQLDEDELPRMEQYLRTRLRNAFGEEKPLYMVASLPALKELEKERKGQKNLPALAAFRAFRREIHTYLGERRQYIQSGKIVTLIEDLVRNVQEQVTAAQQSFADRIEEIHRNEIPAGSDLWKKQRNEMHVFFQGRARVQMTKLHKATYGLLEEWKDIFVKNINACTDRDQLKHYLTDEFTPPSVTPRNEREWNRLFDNNRSLQFHYWLLGNDFGDLVQEHTENLGDEATATVNRLNDTLNQRYSQLEEILNVRELSSEFDERGLALNTDTGSTFEKAFDAMETEEGGNIVLGVGGGLGVAIGAALLFPGVGWIAAGVLALLGGLFGSLFGPSLDEQKADMIKEINKKISELRIDCRTRSQEVHDEACQALVGQMDKEFDRLKRRYMKKIKQYNAGLDALAGQMEELGQDISLRQSTLDMVAANARAIRDQTAAQLSGTPST